MTSTTGKPDAPCKVKVTNPRGMTKELPTQKIPEGYIATLAPEEVGPHKVNVEFNNKEIPKSPFNVVAEPAIDFSKVKVSGLEERTCKCCYMNAFSIILCEQTPAYSGVKLYFLHVKEWCKDIICWI